MAELTTSVMFTHMSVSIFKGTFLLCYLLRGFHTRVRIIYWDMAHGTWHIQIPHTLFVWILSLGWGMARAVFTYSGR